MNFKSVKLKTKKSLLTYAVLASVLAGGFGLSVSRAEAAEETPVFKYKVDDGEEQTWDGQSNLILFGEGGVSDNGITLEVWGEGATSNSNIFGYYDSVTVNGKTIIFNSGIVHEIRGGVSTSGDASDNIVNINGGEVSDKVVGGNVLSKNGNANNNVVNIDHGNVYMVFGGESNDSGNVNDNSVKIINGSVGSVRAGRSSYSGNVSCNRVEISGGTVSGDIYGGESSSGNASGNRVEISGGTFTGNFIYGGQSTSGDVSGNRVEISGGMVGSTEKSQQIYGGRSLSGNITVDTDKVIEIRGNIVEISGGTVSGYVYGGSSPSGNITVDTNKVIEIRGNIVEISGNIVEISGGAVTGNIYGGYGNITVDIDKVIEISGNIVEIGGNIVEISRGTITGDIYGGYTTSGAISGNTVKISDGTITGNIYGGESVNGDATGNSVTINGGIFNGASLYGGVAGEDKTSSGNTLNVNTAINGNFVEVSDFQVMNFSVPAYYANSQDQSTVYQMLNVTAEGATSFDFRDVDIKVTNAPYLAAGDYITLIRGVNGTTFSLKDNIHYQVLQFPNYVELVYANGTPMPGTDYIVIQKDGNVLKQYYSDYGGKTYDSVVGNMDMGGLNPASYSNNEVVINKGTYTQSISGASASNNTAVTDNKVSVHGGTVSGAVYGGQSSSGNVSGNRVEINGGTISGGVYSGQSSSGAVKYNRVEINSGTVSGAVYGGQSTSGNISGNKVEISGGAFNGASLYGGVTTGISSSNTLFLNTAVNGTVNTVNNFQNIHFTVPSGLASDTPMLSVSTPMSLAGVVLVTDTGALSLSDGQTITLIQGVSETDFVPNVHYTVDKGNLIYKHIDETKDKVHDYTIRQWDKEYNSGNAGTYSDVRTENYTGLLIQGNTTDGDLSNTRYSGNEVIIRKGTYNGKVNGAYYDTGTFDITNNKVSVYGGTVTDRVCGGLSYDGRGDFSGNIVNIFDGTIGSVCGFYANNGTGDASDNVVNISGGEVKADVFGAWIMYGTAHNNMVKVTGGTVGRIYGGSGNHAGDIDVTDNLVIISDGKVSGNIYGGWEQYGKISGNRVEISGGMVGSTEKSQQIYGGSSPSGNVSSNIVEISGGMVGSTEKSQQIYGGQSDSGTVSGNRVEISGGTVSGTVYGGYSISGNISGNTVKVSGGNLIDATLYGWGGTNPESHSNNVLQIENPVAVKGIGNFDSINLVLPENVADNTKILTMTNPVNLTGVAVNVYLNGQEPDTITLIDKVENSGTSGTYNIWVGTDNSAELRDNYTISVDNGSLLLKANVVLWYRVGDEARRFASSSEPQSISDTSGNAVVLYRGAGDSNEYTCIDITGALTVGAETETGKSFLVSGDLTANGGVTIQAMNTLNVGAGNLNSDVTNNGTVNLGAGTLAKNITGTTGTTTLTGDVNFINGNKIEGTLNGNEKNVTLVSGTNTANTIDTFTVGTLTGITNLNLDVDMSSFTSDKLAVTTLDGSVVVNSINVTKDIVNNPLALSNTENNKITYLTKTAGNGTTTVKDSAITLTNNYKYTFTAGDTGKLNYKVEAANLTFKKFMEGNLSGNITTLSLTEDLLNSGDGSNEITQALTTMNINLNGHKLASAEASVVTVTTGKTLNINGGSDVQNAGTVDAKTDFAVAGTLAVSGNTDIKGDITNSGTVTFAGTTIAEGSLSGEGTYSNSGTMIVADAGKLRMTKAFKNTGTLELQGGNLEAGITDITSAAGTTIISGTVINTGGKEIFQKNLNIASGGDFTTSADTIYSVEVINDNGNLNLTGGKLERPVQGTGNITFSGDVTTIADNIATTGINTVETEKKLILDGGTLTQKVQGAGNLDFTGDVTTNADNIATTGINEVATGVTVTFTGGAVGGDISGAGKVEIAGNVTSAKNISNAVTVDSGAKFTNNGGTFTGMVTNSSGGTYTITSGTQSNTVANSGTFNVQGGTVGNNVNNTTGSTMNVSGGTVTGDIIVASGAVLNISGGFVKHFDNKGTVNVSKLDALTGFCLYNDNGVINFNADGTLTSGNIIDGGTLNVNANVAANIDDMTAVTTNIAPAKSLTLTGSGTLSTTLAGEGNVVFNDNVSTDVQHLGNTGKHSVASGKILTINAGIFDENFVTEGTVTLAGTAVYQTTAGNVFTEGNATEESSGAVTDAAKNKINFIAGNLALTDNEYSLSYLMSAQNSLKQVEVVAGTPSTTRLIMLGTPVEKEISIDDLKSFDENVILNNVEVSSDSNKKNLIIGETSATGYDNAILNGFGAGSLDLGVDSDKVTITNGKDLTLGGTEGGTLIKVNGEEKNVNVNVGQDNQSATLNIGNGVVSPNTEYKLPGTVNITGSKSKMNVRGQTNITQALNMAGGEVAVAPGAQLTVPTINVTENAQMTGKIATVKLAGASGKVITVGNANAAGHVSAKETKLNGGILFLDPAWVNGVGIEGATHFATETTDLDGAYVVGQNSVLTFGATNEEADTQFKTSGLKWGESNITAAAYVADNIDVAGGSLTVDGNLVMESSLSNPENGNVTLAAKSLLMVKGDICENVTDAKAAVSGVTSATVDAAAHVFIQGAKPETTYKILAGTGIERTFAEENVALPGTIKDATVDWVETDKTYLNITTGELKFSSQNTVMPNVGEALVQSGNEQFAQMIDCLPDQQTANVNAYANLGENLGVSRGAYDVANMVGDAIDTHWDSHHEDKDVWAVGTRDKVRVDGVELGGMEAQYDAQYNGAVVGVNLSGNFGMAVNYTDGKVNNRLGGHNDAEYYGGSMYAKTDWGNLRIAMDATYTYGKNELSQNGITADAKTETISGGLTAKYLAKAGLCKIGPFAGIRYIHIEGKDYTDSLGVNREADKINSMVVPVGLEFTGDFEMPGSAWTFRPVLIAGYLFNFGDRNNKMFMRYNEAMDTFGYDLVDKGAFFARAGMNFSKKNFTLGISYDIMKSKNSEYDRWNINADVAF